MEIKCHKLSSKKYFKRTTPHNNCLQALISVFSLSHSCINLFINFAFSK